jgi:hypothetical protein
MRRATLVCIAIAAALAASPLGARQIVPDGQAAPELPAAPPPTSELPPPVPPTSSEPLPPFPHYPARAPREHNPNYRRSAHASRHASPHHRATRHQHHAKGRHHGKSHRAARQYFSKRTVRQCHRMTYKQIMRHKYCRTMMEQDLASTKQHRHHAHHRPASHHHHRDRRHARAHHRRR